MNYLNFIFAIALINVSSVKIDDTKFVCIQYSEGKDIGNRIIIIDDSLSVYNETEKGEKYMSFEGNRWIYLQPKLSYIKVSDYVFERIFNHDTSSMVIHRLGKSSKIAGADYYHIEFFLRDTLWTGELDCLRNIVINSRLIQKIAMNGKMIITKHEAIIFDKKRTKMLRKKYK